MANVKGSAKLTVNVSQTPSTGVLSGVALPVQPSINFTFNTSGTLADQCDLEHSKIYSFVASTPQTIDLTTVTDVLGGTAAFARIRFMTFKMKSTTDAATLIIGNAATTAWSAALGATGTLTLRGSTATNDGGFALWSPNTTGYVVDSTHKSLLMTPSAHAFDVEVYIFGASA
jgi:hypothetical protein